MFEVHSGLKKLEGDIDDSKFTRDYRDEIIDILRRRFKDAGYKGILELEGFTDQVLGWVIYRDGKKRFIVSAIP